MASNQTNNPYVLPGNQTVISNITSAATGAVNNVTKNAQGADGSIGSIASNITQALAAAGGPVDSIGGIIASGLDQLISGSSSYFTKGSPERITSNALANRNTSGQATSNPETKIPGKMATTNDPDQIYPSDLNNTPYYMCLQIGEYARADPLGNTAINPVSNIFLPLPDGGGLVDNTQPRWSEADLGAAGNIYDNLDALKDLTGQDLSDAAIYAGLAALSTSGKIGEGVAQVAQSAAGIAPNPSLSMMFNGVNFRSFTFDWMFAPKSADESNALRDIIRSLKAFSLPTFAGNDTTAIFNYPYIVRPVIFPDTTEGYMTDYQWCVMKAVNVHYSPQDASPAFYSKTKAPAFIRLTLELEEMEYRLPGNYGKSSRGASAASALGAVLTKIGGASGALSKVTGGGSGGGQ
jgi:hypothetical protein